MAPFNNSDELNTIMKELWNHIAEHDEMSRKIVNSKLIVRFRYTDPDGQVTLDASDGRKLKVFVGQCDLEPHIEMKMKSEVANEFWLGDLNVPAAIVSGRISSSGPVQKAVALIPAIGPARSIYPQVVKTVKRRAA